MSYLPAATRCVLDGVNNVSLSNSNYEWAVGTWHIAKCWYNWHNARRGKNITLGKLQYITDNTTFCRLIGFQVKVEKNVTYIEHKFSLGTSELRLGHKRIWFNTTHFSKQKPSNVLKTDISCQKILACILNSSV